MATEDWTRVDVRDEPRRVRYYSSDVLYEEGLRSTRWVGSSWSPNGRVEAKLWPGPRWLGQEAFSCELDGQSLHRGWVWEHAEAVDPSRPGTTHHVVTLRHESRPVRVRVHTVLDGTPVLMRWLELENTSDRPVALGALASWSGRLFPSPGFNPTPAPAGPYRVGYFRDNQHSTEGNFTWTPIENLPLEIGEIQGHSGWGHPLAYFQDEAAGVTFVVQLQWSGNWTLRIDPRDDMVCVSIGPAALSPQRVLEPGETFAAPPTHVGCVIGDLTAMVQALHAHQRRSVLPKPPAGRRVLYNTWNYDECELTEESLHEQIESAAEFGAEAFTIDAGWWGNVGEDWYRQRLGDWRTAGRLPNGLKPLFDHARQRGLACGLWVWIEGATFDSAVVCDHPDWLIRRDGVPLERVLDLSQPACAQWCEDEICRLIDENQLDIFRIDYNETPGEGGTNRRHGYDENTLYRHYEALYAIFDRVRQRYPQLTLENCASGGRRTDLGMMSRFHYTQKSDYFILPRAVRIQSGLMLALPPETLMRMTGVVMEAHIRGDLASQLRLALLCGQPCLMGVWPTRADLHPPTRTQIQRHVTLFKQRIRPWIESARVFHHDPVLSGVEPTGWATLELAAADGSQAALGVFRLAGPDDEVRTIRPRGLRRDRDYRVTLDNEQTTLTLSGHELQQRGVDIRLAAPLTSELLLVESV